VKVPPRSIQNSHVGGAGGTGLLLWISGDWRRRLVQRQFSMACD